MTRHLSKSIYVLSGLLGLIALVLPLIATGLLVHDTLAPLNGTEALANNVQVLTTLLVVLCLVILLIEVQGQAINAKIVATLGVLVAVASVLRFLENAIPGPAGFSPIFIPIILSGYVFGSRFGFLMGVMTLFTSAVLTGGIGPWLPYQMMAAGWMGMSAGWLPTPRNPKSELVLLALFGFLWGLLFGLILNLYFWPFIVTSEPQVESLRSGGFLGYLANYGTFYATSSLIWDLIRSIGNVVLIITLGTPMVRALTRIRDRFRFKLV